ncbi:hypothetical protein ACWFNS_11290 [Oerskovia enterophila]
MDGSTKGAPAPTTGSPSPRTAVTFPRVLAAEWTKLTGLRSSLWLALGTVLGAASVAYALGMFVRPGDGRSGASLLVSGYVLAQLGFLVLGMLIGTTEYSTGTFRATFTAVPRRLPVLAAQLVVTAASAFVVAVVALLASYLVTIAQRSGDGPGIDLTDGPTARVLGGFVLYQTGVALLGLGIGALVRRATAALVAGVVLLVVLDQVLATNPGRAADTARALLPGVGARLLYDDARLVAVDVTSLGPHLGPWGAGLVLGLWSCGLLVLAGYRLRHHDVA